ncbi:hypothetical protein [Helicobacter sp. 11S02596-1]|uniref:hypothetical protein n=1 Tax=Helicobacter sp. 11S02596-1 TaxID=1476194 RepID=UPI000BA6B153|nr:hypothetical protein [Helicobacter sp. 11S02596-1]PAF41378.1 hypothetical protein BJI48_08790 [Helicobacter sp. 11S02596-1]
MFKKMMILSVFCCAVFATQPQQDLITKAGKTKLALPMGDKQSLLIKPKTCDTERRGCCSWHGGVCGCSNGRAVCCDGTASPSCGC